MNSVMNADKIGGDWVGQVIDGQFPLLRWLGGNGPGGVYLTQLGDPAQNAAIKLIPAGTADPEALLAQWTAATRLSHPHLMRLYRAGRSRVDDRDLVYAVTEYSEEFLSEILFDRPLTPGEVREMLQPTLGVLSWLHAQGLVHGGLKPSNLMVVNDQLKLSPDRIQPAGNRALPVASLDVRDAPESADKLSPAADVWSLGALLIEALTQHPPQRDGTRGADPLLPASVPEPFATIARECLCFDPGRRCTLVEIKPLLAPSAVAAPSPALPPVSAPNPPAAAQPAAAPPGATEHPRIPAVPPAVTAEPPARIPAAPSIEISPALAANRRAPVALIVALLLIAAVVGVIIATRHSGPSPSRAARSSAATAPQTAPQTAPRPVPPAQDSGAAPAANAPGAVLHRALPNVPNSAAGTIRGHVRVGVRVQVDPNGNVTQADLESPGPSRYFANLALDAARNWKFQPAQANGRAVPSTWLLHFAFAPDGTEVTPVETSP